MTLLANQSVAGSQVVCSLFPLIQFWVLLVLRGWRPGLGRTHQCCPFQPACSQPIPLRSFSDRTEALKTNHGGCFRDGGGVPICHLPLFCQLPSLAFGSAYLEFALIPELSGRSGPSQCPSTCISRRVLLDLEADKKVRRRCSVPLLICVLQCSACPIHPRSTGFTTEGSVPTHLEENWSKLRGETQDKR